VKVYCPPPFLTLGTKKNSTSNNKSYMKWLTKLLLMDSPSLTPTFNQTISLFVPHRQCQNFVKALHGRELLKSTKKACAYLTARSSPMTSSRAQSEPAIFFAH
jgi:hypothetical protein